MSTMKPPGLPSHRLPNLLSYGGFNYRTLRSFRPALCFIPCLAICSTRYYSSVPTNLQDERARLSKFWIPTGGIAASADEDSHAKLIRAGFLRQAHSGIFHMLPLGRRVQDKVEALIDKHMLNIGASKVALSSISSEEIWTRSGRLQSGSELFRLKDRKDVKYLLAPTHEEEVTELVSKTIISYKELPVRLYQIGRKYRDELRPRHGLLRSREFVMKDLYTFDYNAALALNTYEDVRKVYTNLFDELKLPYLIAEADSGDMGGNLSHEYHFPTPKGEDHIISCTSCDYVANEELAKSAVPETLMIDQAVPIEQQICIHSGISKNKNSLINVWYLALSGSSVDVNTNAIKTIEPTYDSSIEGTMGTWAQHIATPLEERYTAKTPRIEHLFDRRIPQAVLERLVTFLLEESNSMPWIEERHEKFPDLNLQRIKDGDLCPMCNNKSLKVQKAIELGHTFHLGTRYSEPMKATVTVPSVLVGDDKATSQSDIQVPMEMGCHGIGVSRMIGAIAETLADERGLNWPAAVAPFKVVVVRAWEDAVGGEIEVYDNLSVNSDLDIILDDRAEKFSWKMKDADLVGYPVIVVVGRNWIKDRICEVQCRRLNVKQNVTFDELREFVSGLLGRL